MKIQVLGSGCPTCKKLLGLTEKAVQELNINGKVEYLTGKKGVERITELGIMSAPVLVINNEPVLTGLPDDVEKIKELIQEAEEK